MKRQLPTIPLRQLSIVGSAYMQFHAVAALHLKGGVVAGGGMVVMTVRAVAVVRDVYALGYHGRVYREAGGVIVLVPLADALNDGRISAHRKRKFRTLS